MRKFKLIKKYPLTSLCGDKVTLIVDGEIEWDEVNNKYMSKSDLFMKGGMRFDKEEVEGYPEFWQEIIEKDYEILSFIDKINNNRIYKQDKEDKNFFSALNFGNTLWTANNLISSIDIHSVKRL